MHRVPGDLMDIWIAILLFSAGLVGGVLSAVAGGASFFTFPALIFSGLPPLAANATNFVALIPSNIAALPAFRTELKQLGRSMIIPMSVGGLGGFIGALTVIKLGGGLFATAVPYLMGAATILFAIAPHVRKAVARIRRSDGGGNSPGAMVLLFVFSIYGGYFGAGLGQIVLAALILNGHDDFHKANALKNAVISAVGLIALVVYGLSDLVSWPHALIMMAGTTLGGYIGGAVSKHVPQNALRLSVILFGAFLTTYYFVSGV